MKVLIQNPENRKFYGRQGGWDASPCGARDFRTPVEAISFAKHARLANFRLVLHFPEPDGSTGHLMGATPARAASRARRS
jgi:hypothetical protein